MSDFQSSFVCMIGSKSVLSCLGGVDGRRVRISLRPPFPSGEAGRLRISKKNLGIALVEMQQLYFRVFAWRTKEPRMRDLVVRFMRNEDGATAIEYSLIAGGISIVIVMAVRGIGSKLQTTFTAVQNGLN